MLGSLRRRLRLIRYYSASRTRTVWSTVTDIALLSAVALAPLLTWLTDATIVRQRVDSAVYGRTMIDSAGNVLVEIVDEEQLQSPWLAGVTPMRQFQLINRHEDRGWPVTTTRIEHPPKLDRTLIVEQQTETNVTHSDDDPELVAIEQTLRRKEFNELADGWIEHDRRRDVLVLGWVFSSALWCAMLWVVALVGIYVTRLFVLGATAKRHARQWKLRRTNRCPHCGYNLRGLEFNERCPECGNLSW